MLHLGIETARSDGHSRPCGTGTENFHAVARRNWRSDHAMAMMTLRQAVEGVTDPVATSSRIATAKTRRSKHPGRQPSCQPGT